MGLLLLALTTSVSPPRISQQSYEKYYSEQSTTSVKVDPFEKWNGKPTNLNEPEVLPPCINAMCGGE